MNILFLTLGRITHINERGIYTDLMRKFRDKGHSVYIATPTERRYGEKTSLIVKDGVHILRVRTLNIQKTNVIEKGLGTILIENQYYKKTRKFFKGIRFDLVLYSTPPITLNRLVTSIKKHNNATTYLLLKDIFPQNAVDLGMMKKKGLLYSYFRRKEKKLYEVSDYIGCMSPANVEYIIAHNPGLEQSRVEVCPNSIEIIEKETGFYERQKLKNRYNIPAKSTVFIYGGNLGKPQGVVFLIEVLESNIKNKSVYFMIIGSGTEFPVISSWFEKNNPENAVLIPSLTKEEYDKIVNISDVGMIFLDKRFTIPNYPSRLLTYLEFKKPVLAATDANTDLGRIAEDNNYGFWSESGDIKGFNINMARFVEDSSLIKTMGEAGHDYLLRNYTVDITCQQILKHFSYL